MSLTHICEDVCYQKKKKKKISVDGDVEKREALYAVGRM
jgi:hypothetical protein